MATELLWIAVNAVFVLAPIAVVLYAIVLLRRLSAATTRIGRVLDRLERRLPPESGK